MRLVYYWRVWGDNGWMPVGKCVEGNDSRTNEVVPGLSASEGVSRGWIPKFNVVVLDLVVGVGAHLHRCLAC